MTWFYENSMVPLITGVLLTLVFLGLALQFYDRTMLIIGLAIAALTGMVVGIESWIVTDRESVETLIHKLATAVENQDMPTVLNHISPVREDLKERVRQEMGQYRIESCRIVDFLNFSTDGNSTRAESVFVVFARGEQANQPGLIPIHQRVKLDFQKDADSGIWQLTDYAHEGARLETHSF